MVLVPAAVLSRYRLFSLYNSPYPAHDEGRAIDLYPDPGAPAPSPVAGEVVETRTVRAPPKPYAAEHDHLIVIDTGPRLARVLHVDPNVEPGDRLSVGDPLGPLVRSGFFAPWVDDHVHLGFRDRDANPYRASGSLPVEVAVPIEPVDWDGTGRVVEAAETFVVLDAPAHPAPGEGFAGIAAGAGEGASGPAGEGGDVDDAPAGGGVLDGGLPHYDGGGLLPGRRGPVTLAGRRVGVAAGRDVTWDDVEVRANGEPVTGLSLAVRRDGLGAKLVSWDGIPVAVGDWVEVTVNPRSSDAI